jgi:Uma2 family endonuclease
MTHGIATGISMTAEELLRLPRGRARFELIEGELTVMEPGGAEHGAVAMEIGALLHAHVREHRLGRAFGAETGFILVPGEKPTIRAPDAAFVARANAERIGRTEKYWPEPPDLAVEVVSPGDSFSAVNAKAVAWLEAGTRLVIVADPAAETVSVYRSGEVLTRRGEETVDAGDVVPGWAPAARDYFSTTNW